MNQENTHLPTQPGPSKGPSRILALDQLRGYTIFGMILVNFLGKFSVITPWFKHHRDWMSYADTIAPLFLFVVGIGFRLSYMRAEVRWGRKSAIVRSFKRYSWLVLIGIVLYGPHPRNAFDSWWDALVDIGLAGILALPVIGSSASVRVIAAAVYLGLYQILFTWTGYGVWTVAESIDGGPLGPLSWVFPLLIGSLVWDWVREATPGGIYARSFLWGVGLSVLGICAYLPWGGLKSTWPLSQYAMTAPYTLLSTGFCFVPFVFFYGLCQGFGKELPHLTVLGKNPLVIYILHILLLEAHGTVVGRDASLGMALITFAGFYLVCYGVAYWLDRQGLVVKL